MSQTDWYERRHELSHGQVFRIYNDSIVKLDRTVPGDATQWYVASWGDYGKAWAHCDEVIEPGDLVERLADDYAGGQ